MPKKICLQAGHLNCKTNSIVALRTSTGAPGEMIFNEDIVKRISEILKLIPAFTVVTTDANANDNKDITGVDWDLFLSCHYDADVYNDSGGFIDFPEPSTDGATIESQRIAGEIGQVYFSKSGVKQVQKRSNANTRYYYMWKYLSSKTPCVILEFGVGWRKPNDFDQLNTTEGRDEIANIVAEAICKAFDVPFPESDTGSDAEQDIVQKAGYYTSVREMIGVTIDRFSLVSARIESLLSKETDYNNRVEQVNRLRDQIVLLNEQITALENSGFEEDTTILQLNEVITKLHEEIDQLGRDKGILNDEISDLKTQLKNSISNITPRQAFKVLSDYILNFLPGGDNNG
jgi:hypothetical protein